MNHRVRVLLVEDHDGDAALTAERLARSRHVAFEVVRTPTLSSALAWLPQHHADVVLLDLELPDSEGLATVRTVHGRYPELPLIVLTSLPSDTVRAGAIALGAEAVIAKGEQMSDLFPLSVQAVVERNRAAARAQQLATVLDKTPDAVIVVDRDGEVRYVNRHAETFFGKERAALMAERMLFAAPDAEVVELQVPGDKAKVGLMRVVELSWDDEPATLASIRDVTQERKLEVQLLMSDRMASLGTLAAGIAHEINNPLAAVFANVDFAIRELTDGQGSRAEALEALGDASDACERIRSIVRDLRFFSHADESELVAVDVAALLESVTRMAWNEIRHRARLAKDYGPIGAVLASESRLSQVILNLLVNAAQAIPEGFVDRNTIRIRAWWADERHIAISVADTGTGIAPGVLSRIFDPFFTTKGKGAGTGLGLAISQRIVTTMGGELAVESELGVGTCFTVTLPAVVDDAPAVTKLRAAVPAARRRGRVLVVDDERAVLLAVQRSLGGEHDVTLADSARLALDLLDEGARFDVILCDVMMPDITGMAFAHEVETRALHPTERLVLMTGGAFTAQARSFLDVSPYLRVEKPFDLQGLRTLVNRLIG